MVNGQRPSIRALFHVRPKITIVKILEMTKET